MHDSPAATDAADTPDTAVGRRLAVGAALLAAFALVIGTIGPPLFGKGVFLTADTIFYSYPWRAHESPALLDVPHHGPTTDTVDAIYPTRVRFADAARDGDFLGWEPLVVGGTAVGSESTSGVMNPLALPYLLLPGWYAPAAAKALQMAVAIGFTYLFCRRVGATKVPALFAGMAYAGSGFLVMWTNWQQPEVAALIPALFWATERHLQRPAVATAVPIAVALASMLLGGFPAVVGYTLYLLAGYVAIRLFADRGRPAISRVTVGAGAGAGLIAGVLLAAAVLVPFAISMGDLALGDRQEGPGDNLGVATLLTTVAPEALGLSTRGPDADYFGTRNQVEGISFVGATTVLGAFAALCLPAPRAMPRGARAALAAATVCVGWATFAGGPPLRLLQYLPVFSDNYIGRTRSVLGFTVAVLAALGLQALLERRSPADHRAWMAAGSVVAVAGALAALVGWRALGAARTAQRTDVLQSGLVLPVVVAIAALALLALIRFAPRRVPLVGLVGLSALLAAESLRFAVPLLPNEDRSHLYPTTPGLEFLAAHQGSDRVAPEGFTLFGNAAALHDIRSITGHTFNATTWMEALIAADAASFDRSPTYAALRGDEDVMRSPVLDRLGVRWFAATPQQIPPGRREDHGLGHASCDRPVELSGPVTVTLPAGDGIRGVMVHTCGVTELPAGASVTAEVRSGRRAASGRLRFTDGSVPAQQLSLAVPAEEIDGDTSLTLALDDADGRALHLATTPSGSVGLELVRRVDDGMALRFADDLRIYERTTALPRIRWAGRSVVVADPEARLSRLSGGGVDPDTVVLSEPGADDHHDAPGTPAEIAIVTDSPGSIDLAVAAERPGFVVVADALQTDWTVTVDGSSARLFEADHAGVAVEVPAGSHEVALRYAPRGQRAGLALSSFTAAGMVSAVAWERRRRRLPGDGRRHRVLTMKR